MGKLIESATTVFQNRTGRCLIVFLIIMVLLSFGALWIVTKVTTMRQEKIAGKTAEETSQKSDEHDWKSIAESLNSKYKGRIVSVLQLNSAACRISLAPGLSDLEAVDIAENIGRDIRDATAGNNISTPTVHVFLNGKHVAVARPSGSDYIGEVSR